MATSLRFLISIALVISASSAAAQTPTKVGPVFTVESTAGDFRYPKIAMDDDGGMMVVWRHDENFRGRLFSSDATPLAGDFVVQTPDVYADYDFNSHDGIHDVASDGAGGFVVIFNASEYVQTSCLGGPCVYTRSVDDAGVLGAQNLVQPLDVATPQAGNVEIAGNGAGTFVAAWEGYDSSGEGIFGRTLSASGSSTSGQFQANTTEAGYQGDNGWLDVAGGPAGEFVVAWYSDAQGATFRRFDAAGTPLAGESIAAADAGLYPVAPQVAFESGGNFLILWEALAGADMLQARVFDNAGTPVSGVIDIAAISYTAHPTVAGYPDDGFVVVWTDPGDILKGQKYDRLGNPIGSAFDVDDSDGYGNQADVATDADGNFTVTWIDYEPGQTLRAQRFSAPDFLTDELTGKKLKITNKVPEDPSKRKLQWVVKDPTLDLAAPGSEGDPRCNGDPSGTVKATLRVSSETSSHDTGDIELPCQAWTAVGSGPKLGYQYKDVKLLEGPCKFIKLKTGKLIRATCLGKGPSDLDFDLEAGTAEGTVQTVLTLGNRRYCTQTPPFAGKDGSDGRLFLGKNAPAPTFCP